MADLNKWDTWPAVVTSSKHVGQMLEWVRWKTRGKVQLVIAVGPASIAVAKAEELTAENAIAILEAERDTISDVLRYLQAAHKPSAAKIRPDGR
jgi:hypothetical protein